MAIHARFSRSPRKRPARVIIVTAFALAPLCLFAQNTQPLNRDAILGHLNAVITWYRDSTSKIQAPGLPSDAIYEENVRSLAAEAVRLAFQSARAEAAAIRASDNNNAPANQPSQATASQQQDFTQMAARISAQIDDIKSKLDDINKKLQRAPKSQRKNLLAQRDALQGELSLNNAVLDAIQKMASFVQGTSESGGGDLEASIDQLARSVPEVEGKVTPPKPNQKPATPSNTLAQSSGLIGQGLALFGEIQSIHQIDQMLSETDRLHQTVENLRNPLRDTLRATIQRGQELVNQAQAPGAQRPQNTVQEFQGLTEKFKQLSNATVPLSQELVVIEQARSNFVEWRRSISRETSHTFRALLIRVIGIGLALAILLVLSEVWRRLTFRYIHDARRRRQFLLIRRFVMGFLVGVVLIMGFVSEFSSLATFAGFVTAGIAVGLQAVLLSVAAYFFVVGRYGIRVGDRISVAGVTGDVIDIGLVRMYIMELAGTGIDLHPTGRIVAFSNSVLFQAGTPLFKQIPGTEYTWHEVAVPLTPSANYKLVQDKLFSAINSIYEKYRANIEGQLSNIERNIEVQLRVPVPEGKLQLSDAGLEFVVRYPVDIRRAEEIDDQVTRAVIDLINSNTDVKAAVSGLPRIRAAIKG